MPTTFTSDLKDLRPQTYTQQLPLDEMFRGLGYKQAEYDQGVQNAKAIVQSTANILHGEGPDAEAAASLKQELNDQLTKATKLDYSDPNAINQLSSFVTQFSNRPEVIGIAAHNAARENYRRQTNQLEAKGKTVSHDLQPAYQQMQAYDNSGSFDPNARFSGAITPDYDFNKFYDKISKLPSQKSTTVDALGNTTTIEGVDLEQIKALASQDGEYMNYHNLLANAAWAKQAQGQSDDVVARTLTNNDISGYNQMWQRATEALPYEKDPAQRQVLQQTIQVARRAANDAQESLSHPGLGASYRAKFTQDFLTNQLNKLAHSYSYVNQTSDAKGTLERLKAQHDLGNIKQQALADAGMLTDDQGHLIPGKAEIAGETAAYKQIYKADGSSAGHISNAMLTFHELGKDPAHNPDIVPGIVKNFDVTGNGEARKYGNGWHQTYNQSFLENWEKDNHIGGNGQPQVAVDNGAPAIYVKGGRVLVATASGSNYVYQEVTPKSLFDAEVTHAPARYKSHLIQARDENISGNFTTEPPISSGGYTSTSTSTDGKTKLGFKNGQWYNITTGKPYSAK